MQKTRKRAIISVLLVAAVLIAIFGSGVIRKKAQAGPVPAGTQKTTTLVQTTVIKPARLDQNIVATGTVLANEEIDLKNEIAGRVMALNFVEGRPVQQGALLVKINDADLRASQKKLELQVQLAEREEARAKSLVDQKLMSDAEYDAVDNKVQSAKADLENIKAAIAKTEIRAPFSGIVGLRSISTGSNIPVATSIAHLQQIDPVKVEFTVPEKYSKQIHVGTPLNFTVSGSDRVYTGTVYAMEPKINVDTRTITVRAMSRNGDRSLMPGNFAKIAITLNSFNDALSIPTTALVPELNGQKVYIYNNGKATSRKIDIGIRSDSSIQVVSGLGIGDTLITTGVLQIHDGSAVTRN